jgi:hypothetical protein
MMREFDLPFPVDQIPSKIASQFRDRGANRIEVSSPRRVTVDTTNALRVSISIVSLFEPEYRQLCVQLMMADDTSQTWVWFENGMFAQVVAQIDQAIYRFVSQSAVEWVKTLSAEVEIESECILDDDDDETDDGREPIDPREPLDMFDMICDCNGCVKRRSDAGITEWSQPGYDGISTYTQITATSARTDTVGDS